MANTIKLKTSSVMGKSPLVSDLQISEFAWNSYDGKLYGKKNDGTASIVEIGGGGGGGATSLDELSDVAITSAAKGQFLVHNGTQFINGRTIESDAAATVPLTLKGHASQSGNLFQVQNSAASNFFSVDLAGMATFSGGGWNKHAAVFTGEIGNPGSLATTGVYMGTNGGYGWLRLMGSNTGILDFGTTNSTIYRTRFICQGDGLQIALGYNNYKIYLGNLASVPGTMHVLPMTAASQGVVVKGLASQTGNAFESQTSSGTSFFYVNGDQTLNAAGTSSTLYVAGTTNNRPTAIFRKSAAPNYGFIEFQDSAGVAGAGITSGFAIFTGGAVLTGNSGFQLYGNSGVGSAGIRSNSGGSALSIGASIAPSDDATLYVATTGSFQTQRGLVVQQRSGNPNVNIFELKNSAGTNITSVYANGDLSSGCGAFISTAAASKVLIAKGAASQTANLFEAQNSAGTALTSITSDGTVHAKRYTETVANAFNTSLTPSTGTLTVDTSTGNAVLGALSAAVTTWAFTNAPTDNSKVTTVTAVLAGNASYTYGDACSVNGSAVSGGIMWSGGSAPTATAGTDIITFIIVKDSAGTVKVFGSATTNFS